jgi:glycosyltransferase 2 family protein
MDQQTKDILRTLNPWKILLPIGLGLTVTAYLMYSNYNLEDFSRFLSGNLLWIFAAVVVLFIRDAGYVYRIRHITEKELSLKSSIYVILLWEFASAVTPSAVGGTAIAMFILQKEGIHMGRALALVMFTAVLDNLFFIVFAPLVIFLTNGKVFPDISAMQVQFPKGLEYTFILSYALIAVYTFLMTFGLFFRPRAFKWLLIKSTALPFLRRWRKAAVENGNEVIVASNELRHKSLGFWLPAVGVTILVWCARYALVNCLMMAYVDLSWQQNMLAFSRQIIMWIIMLISPTPGGSGIAEGVFPLFFGDIIGKLSALISLFWRLFTYYPYLILGAIVLPRWLRRVFFQKSLKELRENKVE